MPAAQAAVALDSRAAIFVALEVLILSMLCERGLAEEIGGLEFCLQHLPTGLHPCDVCGVMQVGISSMCEKKGCESGECLCKDCANTGNCAICGQECVECCPDDKPV